MKFKFDAKVWIIVWTLCALARLAPAMEVTVYNQNLGLVKDNRTFSLKSGINELKVTDVAAEIDPTSVHFKSLTAPDSVRVIEQDFQYDLLSQERLLQKYIGKEIELERFTGLAGDKKEIISGTLLSNVGGRIVQVGGKIYVNPPGNPILPALPEGLLTQPTLLWLVASDVTGSHNCEISYLTAGMDWHADYVLVTDPKDERMDLTAWVTLDNNSGATYKNAKLKLVAGDVHRTEQPAARAFGGMEAMAQNINAGAPQFAEKAFFEYHLYTLQRPATLRDHETKQIELASASNIPVVKRFIYDGVEGIQWGEFTDYYRKDPNYGTAGQKKVWVMLEFKNSKENRLGMPLPAGKIRVYKQDTDGAQEFIGEDAIDHTPKDELVRIRMGNAFDVVGERRRTNYVSDIHKRWFQESFEIKLRNHKDSNATVTVVEHLYRWTSWKITESSQSFKKRTPKQWNLRSPSPRMRNPSSLTP